MTAFIAAKTLSNRKDWN